jgi:hypothetical protein
MNQYSIFKRRDRVQNGVQRGARFYNDGNMRRTTASCEFSNEQIPDSGVAALEIPIQNSKEEQDKRSLNALAENSYPEG